MEDKDLKLIKDTFGYKLREFRIAWFNLLTELFYWHKNLKILFLGKRQEEDKLLQEYLDSFKT